MCFELNRSKTNHKIWFCCFRMVNYTSAHVSRNRLRFSGTAERLALWGCSLESTKQENHSSFRHGVQVLMFPLFSGAVKHDILICLYKKRLSCNLYRVHVAWPPLNQTLQETRSHSANCYLLTVSDPVYLQVCKIFGGRQWRRPAVSFVLARDPLNSLHINNNRPTDFSQPLMSHSVLWRKASVRVIMSKCFWVLSVPASGTLKMGQTSSPGTLVSYHTVTTPGKTTEVFRQQPSYLVTCDRRIFCVRICE